MIDKCTFQPFLAILVKNLSFFRIAQYFISFSNFFELFFCARSLVLVRMKFERHLFIGFLNVLFRGSTAEAEALVVIFAHPHLAVAVYHSH